MRDSFPLGVAATAAVLLLCPASANAQATPTAEKMSTNHPAPPAGWKQLCITGPNTAAETGDCPVLKYNGYTYWAWSDAQNDMKMAIAAYDATGALVKLWEKSGAHYIWQITVNPPDRTVAFIAQGNNTITMAWDELFIAPESIKLIVAEVSAQAANCVFNSSCAANATDSSGSIPLPSNVSGSAQLQTRTFVGAAGSPAEGKTAYAYRVDMSGAVSTDEVPCVTDISVDFGPQTKLPYGGASQLSDVFVVTQGGSGEIGLLDARQNGNVINFIFNQPVCAGKAAGTGRSSYLVGVASGSAPKAATAKVSWPGLDQLNVDARAPTH